VAEAGWDVIVIGAGAAGLMAAINAAERGRRVLVLEKNRKPGVKILMSGGTRCNITQATDNRGIVAAYGPPGKFLHSALAAFSVQQTIDFFEGGRRRHQGRGDGQDLSRQQQGGRRARRSAAPTRSAAGRSWRSGRASRLADLADATGGAA
jgi:predicted flavoprotein YhiN